MPIVVFGQTTGLGESGDIEFVDVGTGYSIPTGVESKFQYNGFGFNNTKVVDKYRIMSIDGLDDADVRDTREDIPTAHGETALGAFYGGRTIAFNGRIEAYTLSKLRDMQLALRTAFADLDEHRLYFLTNDPATQHYINCRKFSKIQWAEEQKHATAFFRDFLITLRAADPRFYIRQVSEHTMYTNKILNGSFEDDDDGWTFYDSGGSTWTSVTHEPQGGWAYVGNQAERITGTKDNNGTTRSIGIVTENITDIPVNDNLTYTVRADFNLLNVATDGELGISVSWYTSGSVFISTNTTGYDATDVGEFTLQADFDAPATAAYAVVRPFAKSFTALDVVDYYIDNIWFVRKGTTSAAGEIHLPNRGNIETFPRIVLNGPLHNVAFTIYHEDGTEDYFALEESVDISAGQYYTIYPDTHRLLRSDGENKISEMVPDSDWPVIKPGDNVLRILPGESTSNAAGNGHIDILYNEAYI